MYVERMAHSADEWAESVAQSFVPLRVDRLARTFVGTIRDVELPGDVKISNVRCGASDLARTVASARSDGQPAALFVTHLRGQARVAQDGRRSAQAPGQSVLYVTNRPYELHFPSSIEEQVLTVPLRALTTAPRRLQQLTARSIDPNGPVKVLRACLNELTTMDAEQHSPELGRITIDLLDVALASLTGEQPGRKPVVLARRVRQFIAENAYDPALGPDAVAAAFHISRRSLYAVLEQDGTTPADLIRSERVRRAARLLQDHEQSIESVGYRSGFSDTRTFSRAFQTTYGMTPGAYRRAHPSAVPERSVG